MTILQELHKDMNLARKNKNASTAHFLGFLIATVANIGSKDKKEITDAEVVVSLQKLISINESNIALYKDRAPKEAAKLISENALISCYIPEQLSVEELRSYILEIIKNDNLPCVGSSIGKIMTTLKETHENSFDTKLAGKIIKEMFDENKNG